MYEKHLQKAGLSAKEAAVYEACLHLGRAKAPDIAKRAAIKRSTAYAVLDDLIRAGLVSYSTKGRTRMYAVQDPRALSDVLESRRHDFARILPELETLFASHALRPRVQFFEGAAGIKRIYDDTLTCSSKKIYQIVKVRDFIDFPGGDFAERYIQKRVARRITAYAIHPSCGDVYDETYGRQDARLKRFVRYLPPAMFYASMILLYDYKVAMISTHAEDFGFIIESKEFSRALKAQFDFMWKLGSNEYEK